MILVTGGSGFIGSHVVQSLTDLGERCVVIQRRSADSRPLSDDELATVEQADVTDLESLRSVGARYPITGIVHLAGYPDPRIPLTGVGATEDLLRGLLNIVRVATEWGVGRIAIASTIGVYAGLEHDGPLTEDLPLPLTSPHAIPRWKKTTELLGEQLAESTGIEIINMRISGTWGPRGHDDPFFAAPALIHAAAAHRPLDLSGLAAEPLLGDGLDLTYVKDTGHAIALLVLAPHLNHRTYNVASGRVTTNADIIEAITTTDPATDLTLAAGTAHPANALDITRLRNDTGYEPEYDTARAAADYLAWLGDGNAR